MSLSRRLKSEIGQVAFVLTRARLGKCLVRFMVVNMGFALPVEKLRQTPTLLAFYHPQPAYPVHILIVPRRPLDNLLALASDDAGFLIELFDTVKSLVIELGLERQGYRLIANGGAYQDLPLLHFHLISGAALDSSKKSDKSPGFY